MIAFPLYIAPIRCARQGAIMAAESSQMRNINAEVTVDRP